MHGTTASCSGRRGGTGLALPTRAPHVPQPEGRVPVPEVSGPSVLWGGWGGCCQHCPRGAGTRGSVPLLPPGLCAVHLMPSPSSTGKPSCSLPQPLTVWLFLEYEFVGTKTVFSYVYWEHLAPIMNQASKCLNTINANQNCQNILFFFLSLCSWVNFCHLVIINDLGFDFVIYLT